MACMIIAALSLIGGAAQDSIAAAHANAAKAAAPSTVVAGLLVPKRTRLIINFRKVALA